MNEIKAFVGHSFAPEDAELVNAFLKYFDQLENLVQRFSWDHAEIAEPVELAEKVRRKFSEANAFIGICTKKELAVPEAKLSCVFMKHGYRKAQARDFEAKTSDWVTQELGYAMGKGLPLIILQEEGIRRPGGLQGDREYIIFNRERPEQAFGKILEMLSRLSPQAAESGAATHAPAPEPENTDQDWSDWVTPQPSWSYTNYQNASLHLVAVGELVKVDEIYAAYAISEEGKQGANIAELAAHQEFLKILFGKGGSIDRISALAKNNPNSSRIWSSLARSQVQFDNHAAAAVSYEKAANADRSETDGIFYLGQAALEYAKSNQNERAKALIEEIKTKTGCNPELERQLASTINDFVRLRKDEEATVIALERKVDLAPDDFDARFSLAYKHSELGNEDLALYHYLKIPSDSRSAIAWNNLGVSFAHFEMRSASITAYRKAEGMGETLAMSNLGYKFMQQGFLNEAKDEFDKGFAIEGHHQNIEAGLAALTRVHDQESKKQQDILDKAIPKAEFYKKLSLAITAPQLKTLPPQMKSNECLLSISVDGDAFSAIGEYTVIDGGLSLTLLGTEQKREYRIEYTGRITGTQIEVTVSRVRTDGPEHKSLLSFADNKSKALLFVDTDGSIQAMENPQSITPTFYRFEPIAATS